MNLKLQLGGGVSPQCIPPQASGLPCREPKLSLGDMPWQTNHGFPSNQTRLFGGTGLRLVFPQADGEGDTEGAWHTVGDIKS